MKNENEVLLKIEQKVIDKKNKIDQCKAECKKCSSEIKILRKELKKSSPSPKVAKMLAKWLSQKDKLTSKVHKLKEDCKKHNMKLKKMKTKMRKSHVKKGGSSQQNSDFDSLQHTLRQLLEYENEIERKIENGNFSNERPLPLVQSARSMYGNINCEKFFNNPETPDKDALNNCNDVQDTLFRIMKLRKDPCRISNRNLANSHLPITVLTDSYKLGHPQMYPDNATKMIAYGEFRGPMKIEDKGGKKNVGDDRIVVMGLEYIIKNYINRTWCKEDIDKTVKFFETHAPGGSLYQFPAEEFYAIAGYKCNKNEKGEIKPNETQDDFYVDNFKGKIPITVEGLPDGSVVLPHTPVYKITAEKDQKSGINFSKLITFFETILTMVWYPSCVATLSRHCKQIIENAYIGTGLATGYYSNTKGDKDGKKYINLIDNFRSSIQIPPLKSIEIGTLYHNKVLLNTPDTQDTPLTINHYIQSLAPTGGIDGTIKISMHDFGFRGATTVEQSMLGGMAHLLNFDGTDTMSAAYQAFKANDTIF